MYTLKFLPSVYSYRTVLQQTLSEVQRHRLDCDSMEAQSMLELNAMNYKIFTLLITFFSCKGHNANQEASVSVGTIP
jgi:hypothetical protein